MSALARNSELQMKLSLFQSPFLMFTLCIYALSTSTFETATQNWIHIYIYMYLSHTAVLLHKLIVHIQQLYIAIKVNFQTFYFSGYDHQNRPMIQPICHLYAASKYPFKYLLVSRFFLIDSYPIVDSASLYRASLSRLSESNLYSYTVFNINIQLIFVVATVSPMRSCPTQVLSLNLHHLFGNCLTLMFKLFSFWYCD